MQHSPLSASRTGFRQRTCSMAARSHPHTASADTRHPYASIMLEAGVPVVTLARWLGHPSPTITLGYYADSVPEAGSKGRGTVDGLLGERGE